MTIPILFNPDNRLLSAGTGDLSMYGGQSDPHFSIQQVQEDAPVAPEPQAGSVNPQPAGLAVPDAPLAGQSATASPVGEIGAGSLTPTAFLIAAPAPAFEPVIVPAQSGSTAFADWHPDVSGAGTPIPSLTPIEAAHPAAAAPETIDTVITGTAAPLLDHLSAGPDLVTGLVSPLVETVGNVVGATVGLVDNVLGGTVGLVDDTLEGLAGSDLLGGVATLVGLVSISDTFDINPLEAPLADSAGDSGLGVVDTLVGDLLPDALLGTHHEDGLLGTHPEHPLGLGDAA